MRVLHYMYEYVISACGYTMYNNGQIYNVMYIVQSQCVNMCVCIG